MRNGDVAGLAAYNRGFSYVAVKRVDGVNTVGVVNRSQPFAVDDRPGGDRDRSCRARPRASARHRGAPQGGPRVREPDRSAVDDVLLQPRRRHLEPARQPRRAADARREPHPLHGPPGGSVHLRDPAGRRARRLRPLPAERHADLAEPAARQERPGGRDRLRRYAGRGRLPGGGVGRAARSCSPTPRRRTPRTAGTQNQIDAPERALSLQLARLGTREGGGAVARRDGRRRHPLRRREGRADGAGVERRGRAGVAERVDGLRAEVVASLAADKSASYAFSTRQASVPAGTVSVQASATVDGSPVAVTIDGEYAARTCG